MNISPRLIYSLATLFGLGLVAVSFYMQHAMGLDPCPLCLVQRVLFGILGLVCLIGIFYRSRLYGAVLTLIALAGTASALRKIWLEHLPKDQVPPCGPDLQYMLDHLPFQKTLEILFMGSGDCSKIEWSLFGVTLSEWGLLGFLAFLGLGLWQLFRSR